MLKPYNTLSKKKEVFSPISDKRVNLFVCGPTVYDFSHIGHARTYIAFDMIVKYLRQKGYNVFYLQNITDIDDKIIKRAKEKGESPIRLARRFEKKYFQDMKALKVDSVTKYARATAHIKEIINQVKRLKDKGFAYKIEDGIYYDINRFKDYGKLSKRTVLQAEDAVSRIDESKRKRNRGDFCLWKFSKTGEPKWKSIFGWGRPGWHIEDTAITEKYFGPQYDIHGGARDLIFPHHEAEIAQMEAISGKKPLVKYWFHTGFLTVRGAKMSKSLGNFITIRDFLKDYSPRPWRGSPLAARILRLFVVETHYRSPINYSEKTISQIKKEIERIDEFVDKLENKKQKTENKGQKTKLVEGLVLKAQKEFEKAMDNDFNTSVALAVTFNLVNKGNSLIAKNKLNSADAKIILDFLKKIDKVFGFIFWKKPKEKIPGNILKLVQKREKYRKEKNFEKSDETRKKIKDLGYQIKDTKEGPKIKRI